MATVPYYGRDFDESFFTGKLGSLVLGLNKLRRRTQRAAEVAVVLHEARRAGTDPRPALRRMLEEGLDPVEMKSSPPLEITISSDVTPGSQQRQVRSRSYSQRERLHRTFEDARDPTVREDTTINLFARYSPGQRSTRYGKPPVILERVQPLDPE